jgi:lipooligosaccharide transport system permease protein
MISIRRSLRVCERHLLMWRSMAGASLVGNVLEPLIYLVVLGYGVGAMTRPEMLPDGLSYRVFYGSGLLASVAMFTASFESMFGAFTRMMSQRTYECMIATPISLGEVLVGDALFAGIKGAIAALCVPLVMLMIGDPVSPLVLLGVAPAFLVAFLFASSAILVTAYTPDYAWFNYYITLVLTPLFLFGGIFFPVDRFGEFAALASVSPLGMGVQVLRPLVLGHLPAWQPVLGLVCISLLGGGLCLWLARRKMQVRLIG